MPSPVQVSSIPTLSDLYKNAELESAPSDASSLTSPSSSLNSKVSIFRGSITTLATTSIVNAANNSLLGGGGVDGAIHSAAGSSLLKECRNLKGCETGSAKITSAHALPSSYIIHAVGPIYAVAQNTRDGLEEELLRSCYKTSLDLAAEKGGSIAFSCLSTGIYGYPSGEAAQAVTDEVRKWLLEEEKTQGEGKGRLERVVLCLFEEKDVRAYREWLPKAFPPTPEELPPTKEEDKAQQPTSESTNGEAANAEGQATEPQSKKLKTDAEDLGKDDWEAVEKPSAAPSEKSTALSEEGEKVEEPDLAESDGEKIEKPKPGEVQNNLAKDW